MNPMFPSQNGRSEKNQKKSSPSTIERATHDIVNQLSIICLCCCELRHSLAEKLLANQLDELGKIEGAVQEAAQMIEKLKANLQDYEHAEKNPAPA